MAEYMDYNDVEIGYKSKRHKIFSTIRFYIAVAFLLFVVIWTFTHLPENVRTNFQSVVSSAHKIGEKKTKTDLQNNNKNIKGNQYVQQIQKDNKCICGHT